MALAPRRPVAPFEAGLPPVTRADGHDHSDGPPLVLPPATPVSSPLFFLEPDPAIDADHPPMPDHGTTRADRAQLAGAAPRAPPGRRACAPPPPRDQRPAPSATPADT